MSCCGSNNPRMPGIMSKKYESYSRPVPAKIIPQPSQENYSVPCCRPQAYLPMDQTWAVQKRFQL